MQFVYTTNLPFKKKVSWASRAGCCCGWKRASKFQKLDSAKQLVAISSKPISKKISRNSWRTFIRGCKWPPAGGTPTASKLYFLKEAVFHSPLLNNIRSSHSYSILVPLNYLCNISYVISVASFLTSSANSGPLVTLYEVVFLSSHTVGSYIPPDIVSPNVDLLLLNKLTFLEVIESLGVLELTSALDLLQILLCLIFNRIDASNQVIALLCNPLFLEGVALANLGSSTQDALIIVISIIITWHDSVLPIPEVAW